MEHSHGSQRREDSAEHALSVEGSFEPHASDPGHPPTERKRNFKELRKLGAVDFYGTTDPAEAELWLERMDHVFEMMDSTPEERYDYSISLLQGGAYSWWKTVPNSRVRPPVLTWDDFL